MKSIIWSLFFVFLVLLSSSCRAEDWHGITLPEETHYAITYFCIPAGSATIRIEKTDYNGMPAVKVTARVWSSAYYSMIYRVNDEVISILDAETLKPYEHRVDYEEGSYRRKTHYIFDYAEGECRSEEGNIAIHDDILDPAGALFYLRIQDMEKKKNYKKDVCDGRKVQNLKAKVVGKKKIATFMSWKESFIVKPDFKDIRKEGVTSKRQEVTLFFLKDCEQVPYLVTGELKIGSLVARLRKIEKE